MELIQQDTERREGGFTLIELLVAMVVVGVLAATAIVGIGGLTGTANHASCKATLDAAEAAKTSYFADNNSTWPSTFDDLVTGSYLKTQNGVAVDGGDNHILDGPNSNWQITMHNGGGTETTFTQTPGC
jgi:prepilin-type N-terminal cleavage/methylation domain-containing protein